MSTQISATGHSLNSVRENNLKSLTEWSLKVLFDCVVLKKEEDPYLLPKMEIVVDESLAYTVKFYGAFLVEDHPVYTVNLRSMQNTTISHLVNELEKCKLCGGVTATELTAELYHHVVPIVNDQIDSENDCC